MSPDLQLPERGRLALSTGLHLSLVPLLRALSVSGPLAPCGLPGLSPTKNLGGNELYLTVFAGREGAIWGRKSIALGSLTTDRMAEVVLENRSTNGFSK